MLRNLVNNTRKIIKLTAKNNNRTALLQTFYGNQFLINEYCKKTRANPNTNNTISDEEKKAAMKRKIKKEVIQEN